MIFGRWTPVGAFGASLLFAGADAFSGRLQISGVNFPYQILGMLPYVLTIIVVAGAVGRAVAPAADGKPYKKG
jgi:simple sugar transport system permease protein